MNDVSYYLTAIVWGGVQHYFFWCDGGNASDIFFQRPDGSVYFAHDIDEALIFSQEHALNASSESMCTINLDQLWQLIGGEKNKNSLCKSECETILDAWNILEDLARTLKIKIPPFQKLKRRLIQEIYQKVFVCADVLDREMANRNLTLSRRERATARVFLARAWKLIRSHRYWREQRGTGPHKGTM
jgi:hypothetical protein